MPLPTGQLPQAPDAVWLWMERLEERCAARSLLRLGAVCGAYKLRVHLSPYAQTLAAHYGANVKDGDVLCVSDGSECGWKAGIKLKNLLGVLR